MSVFEKQGQFAASCEPFAKWCDSNEVTLSVSSLFNSTEIRQRKAWNDVLKNTQKGDLITAKDALAELDRTSRQIA